VGSSKGNPGGGTLGLHRTNGHGKLETKKGGGSKNAEEPGYRGERNNNNKTSFS